MKSILEQVGIVAGVSDENATELRAMFVADHDGHRPKVASDHKGVDVS